MPRRRVVEKREILPDPKYNSVLVTQFVNSIMRNGKKKLARKIVDDAFTLVVQKLKDRFVQENEGQNGPVETNDHSSPINKPIAYEEIPSVVFHKALENIQPWVEVRSSRVGGGTYRVPKPIKTERRRALGLSFLRKAALNRKGNTKFGPGDNAMAKLLALEIVDAYENKGGAVKMCLDMHRSAKANQAYVQVQFQSPQELKL